MAALDGARAALAKLDPTHHPEEVAADLVDVWSAVETTLRSLLGGSVLSGRALITELRQREIISYEQAPALVELLAVRERLNHVDYQPVDADIAAARDAVAALERGVPPPISAAPLPPAAPIGPKSPTSSTLPSVGAAATASAAPLVGAAPATPYSPVPPPASDGGGRGPWLMIVAVLLAVVLAAGGVYYYGYGPGVPRDVQAAIAAYGAGQRAAARVAFENAARAHPDLALPHIYLARLAREDTDFATAGKELKTAVDLDPRSALAERELGAFFLARGAQFAAQGRPDLARSDYDAARRSYVRAIQLDPNDRSAQGFLACAMTRLGRAQEATTWAARAGPGAWSVCAAAAADSSSRPPSP